MKGKSPKIVRNTPEEEADIARQIAEDPDTYEWTDEVWDRAKSADVLFPDYVKWSKERRAALKAGHIQELTITLDRETVNWFKAQSGEDGETGGTKWIMLVEKTLQEHARPQAI